MVAIVMGYSSNKKADVLRSNLYLILYMVRGKLSQIS